MEREENQRNIFWILELEFWVKVLNTLEEMVEYFFKDFEDKLRNSDLVIWWYLLKFILKIMKKYSVFESMENLLHFWCKIVKY